MDAKSKHDSLSSEFAKLEQEALEFREQGVREVKANVKVALVNCDTATGSAQEACKSASVGGPADVPTPVLELWKRQHYPFARKAQRVMSTNEKNKGKLSHSNEDVESAFDLMVQAATALADTWVLQEKVASETLEACRKQEKHLLENAAWEKEKKEREGRQQALEAAQAKLNNMITDGEKAAEEAEKQKQELAEDEKAASELAKVAHQTKNEARTADKAGIYL
jgi:hypothetical protein